VTAPREIRDDRTRGDGTCADGVGEGEDEVQDIEIAEGVIADVGMGAGPQSPSDVGSSSSGSRGEESARVSTIAGEDRFYTARIQSRQRSHFVR
jgi:hypothetical protein